MAPSIMTDPPPQPPRQQPYHHAAAVELPAQMPIQPGQTQQQRVQIPSHMQQQQQYVHPGYSQPGPMHPQMHPQQAATYQGYYPHQYPSTSYQMPQLPAQAQYSQQSAMPKGMQQPQQMQHQMAYQQQQQQQQMAPTCMQERQNFSHQNMPSTSTYTARSPSRVPHPGPSSHSMPQHHLTQQWMNQHYMGGGGPTASGHASSYASPAPSAAPSVMSAMAANFETMSVLSVNTQMTSATGAIPPPCEDMAVGDIQSPQCFSSNGSNISAVENVNPQLVQQPLIQLRQCVTHFHNARCLGDQIDAFERIYQIIGRSDSSKSEEGRCKITNFALEVLPLGVELAVEIFRATYIILHMYATNRYGDIGPNHQRQVEIFRHLIRCAHVIVSLKEFREAPTRFIPLEPSPPVFIQFLAIFLKSTDVSVVEQILYILHELVTKDELKRIYMSKLKDVQLISNLILHIETCRSFRIIHWTGVVLFQLQHGDPMFVRYLMAEDRKPMPLMSAILQKTLPSLREAHQFCAKKYPDREQFNRETRSFGPAAEMMFILIRRLICGTGAQQRNWINLFIQQGGIQIVSYFIQFDDKTFNSIRLLHFVSSDCDPSVLRDMPPEGGPQQMYLVEAFQMVEIYMLKKVVNEIRQLLIETFRNSFHDNKGMTVRISKRHLFQILRAIPRMRPSKGLLSAMGFLHNSTLNRTNNKVALIRLGNMKIFTELIQKNSRLENFAHMNEKSWNIGEQRELLSDIIGLISALVLHYGDQKIEETRKHEDADALRDVS
ncbi:hypothetical protein WR25_09878 isoform AF [Diploscapter pachys]|uniref:Uncharacterized protein n=2 Tax=Diploscapter pachys TaxID=2018661 RepID=A0A2A2LH24_9BILA|nr:hypothetical protein WR25_09878 isoform K [Diploscapter pachys]PAV85523.1 hypothetical protein WR25_09878 isoform L [Diploscapter pachys]PAV85527.1 hypothetical protein WR25_09878 isoform P [Diploscapter pachys]PAV85532.1 hypothetical protein WR25_09878 isoform U [Diploscapter pachys]PAV85536.1 hypothetical protein WR25_09878 isoform Y [Diploscapter pachys]